MPTFEDAFYRLISDTLALPPDFKQWLVSYLEANPPALPTSTIVGAANVPVAALFEYAGSTAPSGYLLCDGTAVSRTTYAGLFGKIGTAYGVGDGSTTFNIPDLRGRMPVGKGTHTDVSTLGNNEGTATVGNRRPKHRTTLTDPGHLHATAFGVSTGSGGSSPTAERVSTDTTRNTDSKTTGITIGTGTATDPLDTSPYLALNYIIKY